MRALPLLGYGCHLTSKGHIKWALHAGAVVRAGTPPVRAGVGGGAPVGLGSLATREDTAPAVTHYRVENMWQLPRGGPPPPPAMQ